MKKNSPRAIPDFAHHPPAGKHAAGTPSAGDRATPKRAAPAARVKPQSTSAKSGRRGQ